MEEEIRQSPLPEEAHPTEGPVPEPSGENPQE